MNKNLSSRDITSHFAADVGRTWHRTARRSPLGRRSIVTFPAHWTPADPSSPTPRGRAAHVRLAAFNCRCGPVERGPVPPMAARRVAS